MITEDAPPGLSAGLGRGKQKAQTARTGKQSNFSCVHFLSDSVLGNPPPATWIPLLWYLGGSSFVSTTTRLSARSLRGFSCGEPGLQPAAPP